MSWLQPTERDNECFGNLQEPEHEQLYRYAQVLAMAARIDTHLLRSLRLRFLPDSPVELELALWFCDVISTRNATGADMYPGVARLFCDELKGNTERYERVKGAVQSLTQHWNSAERLEQTMRWAVLEGNIVTLQRSYQAILYQLQTTDGAFEKREIARWAKRALATTLDDNQPSQEATWLYQYVAAALGSSGQWLGKQNAEPLPDNLRMALPEGRPQKIGLRVYPGVLKFVKPDENDLDVIEVTLPMPTSIQFRFDGREPRWEAIWYGRALRIPRSIQQMEMHTLNGKQFSITVEQLKYSQDPQNSLGASFSITIIAAMPQDFAIARKLASALAENGVQTDILDDREPSGFFDDMDIIRLWSKNSDVYWADQYSPRQQSGHLLIIDETSAPSFTGEASVFDVSKGFEKYIKHFSAAGKFPEITSNQVRYLTDIQRTDYSSKIIAEYNKEVEKTKSEKEIFSLTHRFVSKVMYSDNLYIALYDKKENIISFPFILKDNTDWPEVLNSKRPLNKNHQGKTEAILLSCQPMLHKTREESINWYMKPDHAEHAGNPLASWLGVPITISNQAVGVIAVYHPEKDNIFSEIDLKFLEEISKILSLNIDLKGSNSETNKKIIKTRRDIYDMKISLVLCSTRDHEEDELLFKNYITRFFSKHELHIANNADESISLVKSKNFDVYILFESNYSDVLISYLKDKKIILIAEGRHGSKRFFRFSHEERLATVDFSFFRSGIHSTNKLLADLIFQAYKPPKFYFSYGNDTGIPELLENISEKCKHVFPNVQFIHDDALTYKHAELSSFMDKINNGFVFLVISEKYFHSTYCMLELIRVIDINNNKIRRSVLILSTRSANKIIFDSIEESILMEYWKKKSKVTLKNKMHSKHASEVDEILYSLPKVFDILRDYHSHKAVEDYDREDYIDLFSQISVRLKEKGYLLSYDPRDEK